MKHIHSSHNDNFNQHIQTALETLQYTPQRLALCQCRNWQPKMHTQAVVFSIWLPPPRISHMRYPISALSITSLNKWLDYMHDPRITTIIIDRSAAAGWGWVGEPFRTCPPPLSPQQLHQCSLGFFFSSPMRETVPRKVWRWRVVRTIVPISLLLARTRSPTYRGLPIISIIIIKSGVNFYYHQTPIGWYARWQTTAAHTVWQLMIMLKIVTPAPLRRACCGTSDDC